MALSANRNTPNPRPQAKIHFKRHRISRVPKVNMAMISVTCPSVIQALVCCRPSARRCGGAQG